MESRERTDLVLVDGSAKLFEGIFIEVIEVNPVDVCSKISRRLDWRKLEARCRGWRQRVGWLQPRDLDARYHAVLAFEGELASKR